MSSEKLRVLYIAGYSRCGSTILANVLGAIHGYFNAGELMFTWDRITSPKGMCGCGALVKACEIWKPILTDAFGPDLAVDCAGMMRQRDAHWKSTRILRYLWQPGAREKARSELSDYIANVRRLYQAIQRGMPGTVLIDSSKNPFHLFVLSLIEEIDLSVVHIVRDPRANTYSWITKKEGFREHSTVPTALAWVSHNAVAALLARTHGPKHLPLRYEDFVTQPESTLRSIAKLVGSGEPDLSFITPDGLNLGPNHCVYGNPDLFKSGMIKLKLDERWKAMRTRDRILTTALTWPLMLRFGY